MRARIAFLTRLVFLKLVALFTLVFLSLYAPSTTNALWDNAGGVAVLLAKGTENSLQYFGATLSDVSFLVPKKGAVELTFRYVAMDKVMLFIGITIFLYLVWLLVVALVTSIVRRKPARLKSVDASGSSPPR